MCASPDCNILFGHNKGKAHTPIPVAVRGRKSIPPHIAFNATSALTSHVFVMDVLHELYFVLGDGEKAVDEEGLPIAIFLLTWYHQLQQKPQAAATQFKIPKKKKPKPPHHQNQKHTHERYPDQNYADHREHPSTKSARSRVLIWGSRLSMLHPAMGHIPIYHLQMHPALPTYLRRQNVLMLRSRAMADLLILQLTKTRTNNSMYIWLNIPQAQTYQQHSTHPKACIYTFASQHTILE